MVLKKTKNLIQFHFNSWGENADNKSLNKSPREKFVDNGYDILLSSIQHIHIAQSFIQKPHGLIFSAPRHVEKHKERRKI